MVIVDFLEGRFNWRLKSFEPGLHLQQTPQPRHKKQSDYSENLQSLSSVTAGLTVGAVHSLRAVLFIVRVGNDIVKADFMHTKRTTFPTKMKIGIHLEELKECTEISTFLLSECYPTSM